MKIESAKLREPSGKLEKIPVTSNSSLSKAVNIFNEGRKGEHYLISLEKLMPFRNQARAHFDHDSIKELAETIRSHGIRQPLTVIVSNESPGSYEIVSGERRFRAAKEIGLQKVPCIILEDRDSAEEIALIENIQRSDLHPLELADAISKLDIKHGDVRNIAKKIGKSESTVSEYLAYSKFPDDIKSYLLKKNIRSRDVLRKLSSLSSQEEMNEFLGVSKKDVPKISPKSIIRISYLENEGFNIQSKGVKSLNIDQRNLLKKMLSKLVSTL